MQFPKKCRLDLPSAFASWRARVSACEKRYAIHLQARVALPANNVFCEHERSTYQLNEERYRGQHTKNGY